MGLDVWCLLGAEWIETRLEGEGGRVSEALAGENAAGISHLGVSGQSHHRMA